MSSCPGAAVIIIIPPRYSVMPKFTFDLKVKVPKLMPEKTLLTSNTSLIPSLYLSEFSNISKDNLVKSEEHDADRHVCMFALLGRFPRRRPLQQRKKREKLCFVSFSGRKPQKKKPALLAAEKHHFSVRWHEQDVTEGAEAPRRTSVPQLYSTKPGV